MFMLFLVTALSKLTSNYRNGLVVSGSNVPILNSELSDATFLGERKSLFSPYYYL